MLFRSVELLEVFGLLRVVSGGCGERLAQSIRVIATLELPLSFFERMSDGMATVNNLFLVGLQRDLVSVIATVLRAASIVSVFEVWDTSQNPGRARLDARI